MGKPERKPLSTKAIEAMKPGDKDKADTGESCALRITCGTTGVKNFVYRYTSPITHKLTQVKIGHFPNISLAQARAELQTLKQVKNEGRCPASGLKAKNTTNSKRNWLHRRLFCSGQLKLATVLVDHYTARWLGFYSKKQD